MQAATLKSQPTRDYTQENDREGKTNLPGEFWQQSVELNRVTTRLLVHQGSGLYIPYSIQG